MSERPGPSKAANFPYTRTSSNSTRRSWRLTTCGSWGGVCPARRLLFPLTSSRGPLCLKVHGMPNVVWRVGIIGAGNISEFHLRALSRIADARVEAVVDIDGARADALCRKWEIS